MATISRTGISQGGTIQPAHITNIIDALDGTSTTTTVVASGSFSGSLVGGPVNVSTVTATGAIASSGPITGASLTIDTGNPYGISVTADSMSFNSSNEDFNTEIKHYGGVASTIFSANGISTNNRIVATSFTGSLQGTASFAVSSSRAISSSFATTASFALNAGGSGTGFPFTGSAQITGSMGITGSLNVTGGVTASLFGTASFSTRTRDEFITLNFTHREITDTVLGTVKYFGGFSLPTNSTVGRIGLAAPFDYTIVSSSITVYNASFDSAGQVDYSLYVKGVLASTLSSTIDLDDYIKDEAKAVNVTGSFGDLLTIQLRELADSTGQYQTHVALLLKKS